MQHPHWSPCPTTRLASGVDGLGGMPAVSFLRHQYQPSGTGMSGCKPRQRAITYHGGAQWASHPPCRSTARMGIAARTHPTRLDFIGIGLNDAVDGNASTWRRLCRTTKHLPTCCVRQGQPLYSLAIHQQCTAAHRSQDHRPIEGGFVNSESRAWRTWSYTAALADQAWSQTGSNVNACDQMACISSQVTG